MVHDDQADALWSSQMVLHIVRQTDGQVHTLMQMPFCCCWPGALQQCCSVYSVHPVISRQLRHHCHELTVGEVRPANLIKPCLTRKDEDTPEDARAYLVLALTAGSWPLVEDCV